MKPEINSDQIDELILAFLQGRIASKDVLKLKNWLAQDKVNKDYFSEMYMLWKAGAVYMMDQEKIDKAFQKLHLKTNDTNHKTSPSFKEKKKYLHVSLLKMTAIVFLSLCIGTLLSFLFLRNPSSGKDNIALNEIVVPLGSKSRVVLPDRTEVWLNAGSKLTYSMSFGKKFREVNLEGEGYFKVAKMPEKPFIVHTLKANIKALGTEFNVKAYPDENIIETILVKGSVVVDKINVPGALKNSKREMSIVLIPGQKVLIYKKDLPTVNGIAIADSKAIQPSRNKVIRQQSIENEMNPMVSDTDIETSWKDSNWVIQGEPLKELFIKLGRRFNISIILLDDELDRYKFSGIIQSETLEQVFNLMSLTIPMSYSIEKGKVEVTLNSKLEKKYKRAYKN